jgi:hypothetical protein
MKLKYPILAPLRQADPPIGSVTIERFADGTYAAHAPWSDDLAMGLARGDLDGALAFAREQLQRP